jgi:hypothetical protein
MRAIGGQQSALRIFSAIIVMVVPPLKGLLLSLMLFSQRFRAGLVTFAFGHLGALG